LLSNVFYLHVESEIEEKKWLGENVSPAARHNKRFFNIPTIFRLN